MQGGVPKLPSKKLEYQPFRNYDNDVFVTDLGQVPWSEGCIMPVLQGGHAYGLVSWAKPVQQN